MLDRSAVGQLSSLSSRTKWQRMPAGDMLRSVSPSSNCCYSVLVDKDESCPTADLSNIGRSNGPAYSTGELLNTPRVKHTFVACHLQSLTSVFSDINKKLFS